MKKILSLFVLMLITTMAMWAQEVTPVTLQDDGGTKYVNMPGSGNTATLDLSTADPSLTFNVYDHEGKDAEYSNSYDGYLQIIAPNGYVPQVAGTVTLEGTSDYLTVINGTGSTNDWIGPNEKIGSSPKGVATDFGPVTSGLQQMTLFFHTDGSIVYDGLALTVSFVRPTAVTLSGDAGNYFVKMPAMTEAGSEGSSSYRATTTRLDLTGQSGDLTFHIYDDGGAESNYSNSYQGYLQLVAPEGYVIQLTGDVTTEGGEYDWLTVYEGNTTNTWLGDAKRIKSPSSDETFSIGTITSVGRELMLYFRSDGSGDYAGLNLKASLVSLATKKTITITSVEGGSVKAAIGGTVVTEASIGETVTLEVTPSEGYLLTSLTITDALDKVVKTQDYNGFDTQTMSFAMRGQDVTITPTFSNTPTAEGGLNVWMNKNGIKQTVNIPASVTSFKLYDDGGPDGYRSQDFNGTLELNAPEGYVLELNGVAKGSDDTFHIYDTNNSELWGGSINGDITLSDLRTSGNKATIVYSSARESQNSPYYDGLDITVTLYNVSTKRAITINNPATGGQVTARTEGVEVNNAGLFTPITLSITPDAGYYIADLTVVDENNNPVALTGWNGFVSNTVTFTMPESPVTITPTFTNTYTAEGGLYLIIPETNYFDGFNVTLPAEIESFKVYDHGHGLGHYNNNADGYMKLSVEEGYVLEITGDISTEGIGFDYLIAYDGSDADDDKRIKNSKGDNHFGGSYDMGADPIHCTGQQMLLRYLTDGSKNEYSGLNIIVTKKDVHTQRAITVAEVTGGTVGVADADAQPITSAVLYQPITLNLEHSKGYLLKNVTVTEQDNNELLNKDLNWYEPTATADFIMRESPVTVTPSYFNNLTVEGGLTLNMPKTGTLDINIPKGVHSFKLYDDAGPDADYSSSCEGTLALTTPDGYTIKVEGTLATEYGFRSDDVEPKEPYDYLNIYDGLTTENEKLVYYLSSSQPSGTEMPVNVESTDTKMMLFFTSDTGGSSAYGLDLTVTLVPVIYPINYDLAGGALPEGKTNPDTYTVESEDITLVNPERTAYDFTGWTGTDLTEKTMTVVIPQESLGERSFTATWTPIIYDIAYDLAGGALPEGITNPDKYNIESPDFTLGNPVRTGYIFTGWTDTDLTDKTMEVKVTTGHWGNRSYTATWRPITYTITFHANKGTGEMATQLYTYDVKQALTENAFTRKGYTYEGWNTKADGTGTAYTDKQELQNLTVEDGAVIDIYAQWQLITYPISYNLAGGSVATANPTEYNVETATFTLTNPTRTGYTFDGWTGTDLTVATKTVTITKGSIENRSYTANWTPITYNISYALNDGTVASTNPATYTIETPTFTLVNPTKAHWVFKGWTGSNGTTPQTEVNVAMGSIGDCSFTANWEREVYAVNIVSTPSDMVTVSTTAPKYEDDVVVTLATSDDYAFEWLKVDDVDVTNQIVNGKYTIQSVSANVTVEAKYNATKEFITMAHDQATFCCQSDLDFTESALKAYIASGYQDGTVILTRVYSVPANTGLFLVGVEGVEYKIPYVKSTAFYSNLLKPVITAQTIPGEEGGYTNFLYSQKDGIKGFYKSSGNGTVAAGKAYLQLPTAALPSSNGTKSIGFTFDGDDETAIEAAENNWQEHTAVYDLGGRKVADSFDAKKLPRGVYIVNGKKVAIK